MADLFRTAALLLVSPECYDQYFMNFNFFHGECMKSTISKALGLVIIAGSITVKVPQIIKIKNNRSGEGISMFGTFMDLFAITSFFSYSYLKQFPFSAWGDGLFLAIQTAIVIGLILYYKNQMTQVVLFLTTYTTIVLLSVCGFIPTGFFWLTQILNMPIIIIGKGAQALTNYKSQSTGQLSAITWWMQFGGSAARVFTSLQETGDTAVILTFLVATILNGIIVFQLLYYAKPTQKKAKGGAKGKVKGKKLE